MNVERNDGTDVFSFANGDTGTSLDTADTIVGFEDRGPNEDYISFEGLAAGKGGGPNQNFEKSWVSSYEDGVAEAEAAFADGMTYFFAAVGTGVTEHGYLFVNYDMDAQIEGVIVMQDLDFIGDFQAEQII